MRIHEGNSFLVDEGRLIEAKVISARLRVFAADYFQIISIAEFQIGISLTEGNIHNWCSGASKPDFI